MTGDTCAQECLGITAPSSTFVDAPAPPDLVARYVDLHVHTAPDVFGRALDDDEAAIGALRARMGGIVLKNHASETASRAELLVRRHGIEAWGGVVLNRSVGGVNAYAVDAVAAMSGGRGRIAWLPTLDAGRHRRFLNLPAADAIDVVHNGKPTAELENVVATCAARDIALCTGHTGADDAFVVAEVCKARGVRCCITHALFPIVGCTEAHVAAAVALGATIELCAIGTLMGPTAHVAWMRAWGVVDAPTCARYVATYGPAAFLVSSDLGQSGNPVPADGLRRFVGELARLGISRDDLETLGITSPRRLLGVPA